MPNKKQFHEHKNFRGAIHRVLKQVHPEHRITLEATNELNLLLHKIGQKLTYDADLLVTNSHRRTIAAEDIQSSVLLNIPGELAKHAVQEGKRALTKYMTSGPGTQEERISRRSRSGLKFDVARGESIIRHEQRSDRTSAKAMIFLTAVLEYLCTEILELAGSAATDVKRQTVSTRHITLAILNDSELYKLIQDHNILLSGGVLPSS